MVEHPNQEMTQIGNVGETRAPIGFKSNTRQSFSFTHSLDNRLDSQTLDGDENENDEKIDLDSTSRIVCSQTLPMASVVDAIQRPLTRYSTSRGNPGDHNRA